MATGLEQQLIYGAGQAAKSHQDIIGAGLDVAIQKATKGVKEITTKLAAREEERKNVVKGYDTAWESHVKSYIDDGGLPVEVWQQATDLAEGLKVEHDACASGKEGDTCRKKATMKLRDMAKKWTDTNTFVAGLIESSEKYKGDDPELVQSNYDKISGDGERRKKILAHLDTKNVVMRNKNDGEIRELREQLLTAAPEDQMAIEQEIEALEKSNEKVTGWEVPGEGFMTKEDIENTNLFQPRADALTNHITDRNNPEHPNQVKYAKYKSGEEGGKPFDMSESINANKGVITEGNIASAWYDEVLGTGTLRENIREHPMLKDPVTGGNATYSSLGISGDDLKVFDLDGDRLVSENEIDNLIEALSDPTHGNFDFETSRDVVASYMALNEEMEYKKTMYGHNFFDLSKDERLQRIKEVTDPSRYDSAKAMREAGFVFGELEGKNLVWSKQQGRMVPKHEGLLD